MNWFKVAQANNTPRINARATGQGRGALFARELNTQKHGLNKSRTLANMAYNGINQFKHTGFENKEGKA